MVATLIGLSGYAGSGKDALAAALIDADPRWGRVAFADALRDVVERIDPDVVGTRLSTWLRAYGWDTAKRHPLIGHEVRRILQATGVAVREVVGPSTWIDVALAKAHGPTVVTDVRFPNEAQAIRDRGGIVVRIDRPGCGPVNGHVSEHAMDDWSFDLIVVNDGTPAGMIEQLGRALATT